MKKLTLNKETIANLNSDQASKIAGGALTYLSACYCSGRSEQDPKCYTDCPQYCIYTDGCIPTTTCL
ncbi:MAG: class I lanthipeptide [Candidatus Delongbacteria bacterium]|nr:class I lanthipeptide [Candidatus Delongbacteria bacterium]